jgi:hypothetical protein
VSSQDREDECIIRFFDPSFKGRFLDVGAYDGVSFSNTVRLLSAGWSGVMVEGGICAFRALCQAHARNDRVKLVHAVMAPTGSEKLTRWWENTEALEGELAGPAHPGLASTTVKAQYERVLGFTPERTDAWESFLQPTLTMPELQAACPGPYQVVSIDTEGTSLDILADTDLVALGAELVCVEHNADSAYAARNGPGERARAIALCAQQGYRNVLFDNGVNLIAARS